MSQVAGGDKCRDIQHSRQGCQHLRKERTGNEREDSYFVFWSKHQYEYRCVYCGATFWVTEERD